MSKDTQEHAGFVFTGIHMFFAMIAFFGVIIGVNLTMATLAAGSWTGLVVNNSYVASQKYNAELIKAKTQLAAGLRSNFTYQNGKMLFALKDKNGALLPVSSLTAEIGRPAFEQDDHKLNFVREFDHTYSLATDLKPGLWKLKITGFANGSEYRRDIRLFVDLEGKGLVE